MYMKNSFVQNKNPLNPVTSQPDQSERVENTSEDAGSRPSEPLSDMGEDNVLPGNENSPVLTQAGPVEEMTAVRENGRRSRNNDPAFSVPGPDEGGAAMPGIRSGRPMCTMPGMDERNIDQGNMGMPGNRNSRSMYPMSDMNEWNMDERNMGMPGNRNGLPVFPLTGNWRGTSAVSRNNSNNPVIPLPNPGEGGPVAPGNGGGTPVIPLPNPGEGGPVAPGNDGSTPVIPLPNPGEGGPVAPGNGGGTPVIPLPNPGEGGPVAPGNGGGTPVIPLPNPGEGGPVYPGSGSGWPNINIPSIIGTIITTYPRPNAACRFCVRPGQTYGSVRFLNAASNYNPFRVYVNDQLFVNTLGFSEVTAYEKVPDGYQIITVMGDNQYIYIQKPVMIPRDGSITIAICNTESGLDLFVVDDNACNRNSYVSCIRACNLSFNSGPLTVVVGNNDIRFMNVSFQEVTNYRIIMPSEYAFYVMNSNRTVLVSSIININADASYTIYIFNWNISSPDALRVLIIEEK